MLLPVEQLLHTSSNTLGIKEESPFFSLYISRNMLLPVAHFKSSQTHCTSKQKALPFLVRF
jgi:hypothetical protein